ncbi:MAG: peptidylprolyl isomerase [Burkholderiaceae bacterium]
MMRLMTFGFCAIAMTGLVHAPAFAATPSSRVVDRVIAVVDNEIILESELQRRIGQALRAMRRAGETPPSEAALREEVLERMIDDLALLHRAAVVGVQVEPSALDRTIEAIAAQNGMSVNQLRDQLEREGIPFARFRKDIQDEMTLTRLKEREVDGRLRITEAEIEAFLAAQGQSLQKAEEYLVRQALIPVAESASAAQKAEARDKADQLLSRVRAGSLEGLESMGWRTLNRLPTLFANALRSEKVGAVVGPLSSGSGLHVLKLEDKRERLQTPLVDAYLSRHILMRVDPETSESQAIAKLQALRARIEKGESFETLAMAHSQDPGTAPKGGDLGWAYPGDMVPEYERGAAKLAVGQVSPPVRSQFGFHLIQVLERRQEPLPEDRLRMRARLAVREQKMAEAVENWTREVRASAFVEMKTPTP